MRGFGWRFLCWGSFVGRPVEALEDFGNGGEEGEVRGLVGGLGGLEVEGGEGLHEWGVGLGSRVKWGGEETKGFGEGLEGHGGVG